MLSNVWNQLITMEDLKGLHNQELSVTAVGMPFLLCLPDRPCYIPRVYILYGNNAYMHTYIDAENLDDWAVVTLLQGVCFKGLKRYDEAEMCFKNVLQK